MSIALNARHVDTPTAGKHCDYKVHLKRWFFRIKICYLQSDLNSPKYIHVTCIMHLHSDQLKGQILTSLWKLRTAIVVKFSAQNGQLRFRSLPAVRSFQLETVLTCHDQICPCFFMSKKQLQNSIASFGYKHLYAKTCYMLSRETSALCKRPVRNLWCIFHGGTRSPFLVSPAARKPPFS